MCEISDKITKKDCFKLIRDNCKSKPKIIFILIDKNSSHLYKTLKQFFSQKGLLTQFCTKFRIPRDLNKSDILRGVVT